MSNERMGEAELARFKAAMEKEAALGVAGDRIPARVVLLALAAAEARATRAEGALKRVAEVMPPAPHTPETWCDCPWCSLARALAGEAHKEGTP
jgi:hypothetical protein